MLAKAGAGKENVVDRELAFRFFDALNRFGDGYVEQMSATLQHIFQTRDELSGSYRRAVEGNPVSSADVQAKFESLANDMAKLKSPEKALNEAGEIELPPKGEPVVSTAKPVAKEVSWAEAEKQATTETQEYWKLRETPAAFGRTKQTFNSLAKTLKNKMSELAKRGQGALLPAVDESVLNMPVDEFIRSRGSPDLQLAARRLQGHPDFIKEFVTGKKGQGVGIVGARETDIAEFFLDQGEVVVTDITLDVDSQVHQFKTDFYREVLQQMIGNNSGIRVYGLDINPVRQPLPHVAIHD